MDSLEVVVVQLVDVVDETVKVVHTGEEYLASAFGSTEDDGTVIIYGKNGKATDAAKAAVKAIVEDPEVGTIYNGTVKRIMDFGAFVEILPGKEGLCHISKLSRQRVEKVTDVIKEGQQIPVKLLEIDKMGRLNLSYIDALEDQKK